MAQKGTITRDPALRVMASVERELLKLDEAARARVMRYLAEKYATERAAGGE